MLISSYCIPLNKVLLELPVKVFCLVFRPEQSEREGGELSADWGLKAKLNSLAGQCFFFAVPGFWL